MRTIAKRAGTHRTNTGRALLLRQKLLLLLSGSIVLLTLCLALVTWHSLQKAALDIGSNGRKILSQQTEIFLEKLIKGQVSTLDLQLAQARTAAVHGSIFLSESLKQHRLSKLDVDLILSTLLDRTDSAGMIYFITLSGDFWVQSKVDQEYHLPVSADLIQASFFPEFTESPHTIGLAKWSKVHTNPLNSIHDLVVDAVSPVSHNGVRIGYVGVSVSISRLITQFNQHQPIRGSYSFLMDTNYQLVGAQPHARLDLASASAYVRRGIIDLSDTNNDALKSVLKEMVLGASSIKEIPVSGESKYLVYSPLTSIDWRLGLVVPVSLATAASGQLVGVVEEGTVRALLSMLAWATGLLILSILIGGALTRKLTYPLHEMALMSRGIAEGNFDFRANVDNRDEIGDLAHAFNTMTEHVQSMFSDLEHYNQELQSKNRQLEEEIGERERIQEDLRALNEKLTEEHNRRKLLSKKLIDLSERDKRKVAIELHEDITQVLAILKIDLELISSRLKEHDPSLQMGIERAREKAQHVIKNLKDIAYGLRPSMLDNLGLVPSIHALTEDIKQTAGLQVHFFSRSVHKGFDQEKETTIYRVAQEALSNIVRHAGAKNVFVNLIGRDNTLSLSVEDDGMGFNAKEVFARSQTGDPLGLLIMQERVIQVKGEFSIESRTGEGTHLLIQIPL
jgi:signal transduction histidine kinase